MQNIHTLPKKDFWDRIIFEGTLLQAGTEAIKQTRFNVSTSLLSIFDSLRSHFPKKKHINILSLACGVPDEFLALKAYFREKGITFNFVGIDIDEVEMPKTRDLFAKIDIHPVLLVGDITNPPQLAEIMAYNGCLPKQGFDFVVLRQPNILFQGNVFNKAILETIPYFSSIDARVFISTYHEEEMSTLANLTSSSLRFHNPGNGNLCIKDDEQVGFLVDGVSYFPDSFNVILECSGIGANLHNSLNIKKTGTGQVLQQIAQRFFTKKIVTVNRETDELIQTLSNYAELGSKLPVVQSPQLSDCPSVRLP